MGCASSAPAAASAAGSAGPQSAPPQGERLRASSLKRLKQELWQCAAQGALWDDYDLGPVIGTGTFAVVRRAVHRATGDVVAVKILRISHELAPPQAPARSPSDARRPPAARPPEDGAQDAEDVIKEVAVLRCLDSPYTCRLHSFYLASDALYLVTDFCAGGQLLHALLAKGTSGYSEHDCRTAFTALLRALCYLHARGVTHRDVKLDNVLLAVPGDLSTVRLVDFGLAASCLDEAPDAPEPAMTWMCGSAPYMAPEVALRRIPYTDACDMWSAGVVLHLLLTGHMPFAAPAGTPPDEEDEAVLAAAKSVHWQVTCDAPEWTGVSEQAKALTRALLEPEPSTRLSAAQALLHPWVGGDAGGGGAADLSGALSRLTRFVAIADLPSVKLPPGTLLTADGTFGGSLFAMDGGAFLIKTGRVDVLVPAEEGSPHWPPSSSSTPPAADDGMRPLRRVGSRGAGELVGELSMMHVDGSGKVTWGAHHAGEGSGRHVLTPSLSRKSSGSRPLAAGGEAGSVHGSSAGGSRHAENDGGEASLADGMTMEGSAKGMQLLRTAFLRTATPVEVVPLPRADLEWALAQDAHMAQQVARFVTSASHHDLQAVLAPN